MQLSEKEKRVLIHSLTGSKKERVVYRNHYCASPGHHSWEELQYLVKKGAMISGRQIENGSRFFHVTEKGAQAVGLTFELKNYTDKYHG